ncbi:VRR-NUC domain-containing protein [Candidatus Pacearchaeota archaeon]|nr:VRR-NUC domain-containing protein [Candidatus Pacearchaeota archaeon]
MLHKKQYPYYKRYRTEGYEREIKVQSQLIADGFRTFRTGWPDFLAFNPDTKEIKFVEVKSKKVVVKNGKEIVSFGKLKTNQKEVIEVLKQLCPVEIIYIE